MECIGSDEGRRSHLSGDKMQSVRRDADLRVVFSLNKTGCFLQLQLQFIQRLYWSRRTGCHRKRCLTPWFAKMTDVSPPALINYSPLNKSFSFVHLTAATPRDSASFFLLGATWQCSSHHLPRSLAWLAGVMVAEWQLMSTNETCQ